MILLETNNLTRAYDGVIAVNKVNFIVEEGLITGLIGPNGAGKTTLFNNMTGLDTPTEGKVFFDNKDITGRPANVINRLGISRTFQNIRLFKDLSVIENVMVGRHFKGHNIGGFLGAINSFLNSRSEERKLYNQAREYLNIFNLDSVKNEKAGSLPYGLQRELEIARALASEPKLLFLDEPAAGMNPQETDILMSIIRKIRDMKISVVLIEHDMKLIMNICDSITVLNYGEKIAHGTALEIQNNPAVIEAYLGKDYSGGIH